MRKAFNETARPSKDEQAIAMESYYALAGTIENLRSENPEIEIEETEEKIRIPIKALKLLLQILKVTGDGKLISIIPETTEMTTQAAAEFLGCSRPHLVKMLDEGQIPFTRVGKHRRVKSEDIAGYKEKMKSRQKKMLVEIMRADEESGLYDS